MPLPSDQTREAARAAWLAESGWYSPALHLGATSAICLGAIAAASGQLHGVTLGQLGFALALLVAANAAEWRIHKRLLHARFGPLGKLYDRHTPQHHLVFLTDSMELRSAQEFRLVLIPPWAVALLLVGLLPAIGALWALGLHNHAALFTIVTMGYVVSYEWFHLLWHLPEKSFPGSLGLVKRLKRHHAVHHDPRLMQQWNFNVTLPFWDLVRGTIHRGP